MGRTIINIADMEDLGTPGAKTWLHHLRFGVPEIPFPMEVVARSNGLYTSHKAAAIFIKDKNQIFYPGLVPNELFFKDLWQLQEEAVLLVLHALRPYTYFPWEDDGTQSELLCNFQLELPGGQVKGKTGAEVAIQELIEEAGIGADQVLSWTPAFASPSANDGGTHVERYGLWYVLCLGEPHPPYKKNTHGEFKEGIVGFDKIPVRALATYRESAAQNGIPIELWVHTASFGIEAGLLRA